MTYYLRQAEQSPSLTGPLRALPWADEAVCASVDPELFFPDKTASYVTIDGTREHRAKAICRRCPALEPCRDYAMADPSLLGIWGATSPEERRVMRKEAS